MDIRDTELADTLTVTDEPKSAAALYEAIEDAEKAFRPYWLYCDTVDQAYSLKSWSASQTHKDQAFDLFWSSMEILKPAIYAKAPKPVATPRFKDGKLVDKAVAELMERTLGSEFDRGDIDQVMLGARDDLALTNRGVGWVRYEADEKGGGKRICVEHLDRKDFLHEPARSWAEVGWVARRAWMTKKQMKKRFPDADFESADFNVRREDSNYGMVDSSAKAGVWEVWSRVDNKVYWWAPGCEDFLDEDKPHLNLSTFWPCPKPAFGTLIRRSLIPVPDYRRYREMLDQINILTERVYVLLDSVRLKVLIPGDGDVARAVELAINSDDDKIVIPVPAAALQGAAAGGLMITLPLTEIATTIQGLIDARNQLIENFYQVSGISDIMRGATEAQETLGAQRLKQQNGSVRIRDKIDELARFARDLAVIAAEIIAQNFDKDTLMEISQMEFPTRSKIDADIKKLEDAARKELEELADQAEQAAMAAQQSGEEVDPTQAQQQFQQAQQAVIAKYQPLLDQAKTAVSIEDVMKLLRDKKARNLIIDIETDSTIMVDEMEEKASRAEFLQAFAGASSSIQPLLMAGEAGAKLAGAMLKFALQPYRANRELDGLIDDFIEQAPQMAAQAQGGGESEELVAAQMELAKAENLKAQAQMAKVQADSQLKQAELQGKMQEMQLQSEKDAIGAQLEAGKLELQMSKQQQEFAAKMAELDAKQNLMQAQTAKILNEIGMDVRKQDLEEYKVSNAAQQQQVDTALKISGEGRAERGEERADRQQQVSEQNTDRQMTLAERQALSEGAE